MWWLLGCTWIDDDALAARLAAGRADDTATPDPDDTASDDTGPDDTAPDDTGPDDTAVDPDADADGYDALPDGDDCDDADPDVHPGAQEIWYDGVDQDCDGADDFDQDGDGHRLAPDGDDCDDANPAAHPEAEELPYTGTDEDCDGVIDAMSATVATWTVLGAYDEDGLGAGGVALLPDLDADGSGELVVGSPDGDAPRGAGAGVVSVLGAGSAALGLGRDAGWLTLSGANPADRFGAAFALVGDLDGDGAQELAIGAPRDDRTARDGGAVYLIDAVARTGVATGPSYAVSVLQTYTSDDALGAAVASGDFDGDGVLEVAAGAPGAGEDAGAAYVFFAADGLGEDDLGVQDAAFYLEGAAGDALGGAACFADLDGDGYADLVVCAPGADDGGELAGACFVADGSSRRGSSVQFTHEARSVASATLVGASLDQLGENSAALATADVDGDGRHELAVAAAAGGAWVYAGGALTASHTTTDATWSVPDARTVALGDLTGDDVGDLLVGLPGVSAGAVHLLALSSSGALALTDQRASWSGEVAGDGLGTTLAIGDVDGDGRAEAALAAPGSDTAGSNAGLVYVVPGY